MKYNYNEEQVKLSYDEIQEIVEQIVGGFSFNVIDEFEGYAIDIIEEKVEEEEGTDEDYDEAMEDKDELTTAITEDIRETIKDELEGIKDNISDALYELNNY